VYGMYFNLVFLVRRLIFAICIITFRAMPFLQIQIVVFTVSMSVAYTGQFQPFVTRFTNWVEIINDCFILVYSYHLFVFTEFVQPRSTHVTMGWSAVSVIGLCILFNVVILMVTTVKNGIWEGRKKHFIRV